MQAALESKPKAKKTAAEPRPESLGVDSEPAIENPVTLDLPMFITARVQPKLMVGAAGDPCEKEADFLAEKVVQASPAPALHETTRTPAVQMKANGGRADASGSSGSAALSKSLDSSGGSPLPAAIRGRIEPVLNEDLSEVRVHHGSASHEAARELGARAFAHQNHIFLGRNESPDDLQLMAHEAVHTVQQGGTSLGSSIPGNGSAPLVQRQPDPQDRQTDPQAEAASLEMSRKVNESKTQAVASLTSTLHADGDLAGFITALSADISGALGHDVTADQLPEVQARVGHLSEVTARVHSQPYDYVSAAKFLSRILGLPPDLTPIGQASYGTAYFISLVSSDIAGYITQPLLPAGNVWSMYDPPYLSNSLAGLMEGWGDPQGLLDLELQGSMVRLTQLRDQFNRATDRSARADLGAQIGEVSRRILLINRELLNLGPSDASAATAATPLDQAVQSVSGDISSIRSQAATEQGTLQALGNAPQLLAPAAVTPQIPLGPESSDPQAIVPDQAFPRSSDQATLNFLDDLSARVQSQAASVEDLHNRVVPSAPTFNLQEFADVYHRWFSFFSVAGRDQDPFYQQTRDLYAGLFNAVGIAGVQGGVFRGWLMQMMAPDIERVIGGASTDFSHQLASPQRQQRVTGTASAPQYEYAELFPGTTAPLSGSGETASRGQFQAQRQGQTADLFQSMSDARQRGESPLPLAQRAGMARGGPGALVLMHDPQSRDQWNYLIETDDIYGNVTYQQQRVSPEVSSYLLARLQQRATVAQAHRPGVGDLSTVTGGVESGRATGAQVYLQGETGAVNQQAESDRSQIAAAAQSVSGRRVSGGRPDPAEQETELLIRELEAYLDRYFTTHTEPEYRISAVLIISESEYGMSSAFMRSLSPPELMRALGIALAITALKQALSFFGELGGALSQGIDAIMSLMGVTPGAALVNLAAWIRQAMGVQSFRQARASGFFGSYVADDLGQLVQMYMISAVVHGLGSMPTNPGTPRNAGDALRTMEPLLRDPASRQAMIDAVQSRIHEREQMGGGRDRSDPVLDDLRAVDAELRGVSPAGEPVRSVTDIAPTVEAEGATRGRDVYRIPMREPRRGRGAAAAPDPTRIRDQVRNMAGMELAHGAQLAPRRGTRDRFDLSIPDAANAAAPPTIVSVTVRVEAADHPVWRAGTGGGTHGGEEGPARMDLTRGPGGEWSCTITVHEGVASDDVAFVVGHEMNEVSDLLARNPGATSADIARETAAGLFVPGSTATQATAHDRAAARELSALHADLVREQSAYRPRADAISDRRARLDRMIRAMGLDNPRALTAEQVRVMAEEGVPHDLILDIQSGGLQTRQAQAYRTPVTGFREAQPMMSAATGVTAPGHGRSKHWADASQRATVLSILNSPQRIFTGVYERSGRRVDIYYRDGTVVITDAGQRDRVVTGYGATLDAETPRAVDPSLWAGNPDYQEIPVIP